MKRKLFLEAWHGMGDNIYLRPFARELTHLGELWVQTPWPELYEDLPVHFVHPETDLRTQRKNVERQPASRWSQVPRLAQHLRPYLDRSALSIIAGIAAMIPLGEEGLIFDLPDHGPSPVTSSKPIAVIRPVVVRKEWQNEARNPPPGYLRIAAAKLRERGFHVVSIADLEGKAEWLVAPRPPADEVFHHGELVIEQLVALVRHAAIVVGGVGWILPMAIATKTPLIIVAGGNGRHNSPERLISLGMDDSQVRWIMPDNYCRCGDMMHQCDRRIRYFGRRFSRTLEEVA